MSQMSYLIVNRIYEKLLLEMQTNISLSDKARADKIQPYRFQEDPLKNSVHLYVTSGDPENPNYRDSRISIGGQGTGRDTEDLDIKVPSGEIGGGHLWWRRGRVVIGCYFIKAKYNQSLAADTAHIVLGRAMHWIERTYIADLKDDFGEVAIKPHVYASHFFESGGPENQYIWRGQVWWQALTQRTY